MNRPKLPERIVLKAAPPMALNRKPGKVELAEATMEPLEGFATRYGVEVERWWGVMELAEGCFDDSLQEPESIRILSQHWSDKPIGIAREFRSDSAGLYMKAAINTATQEGFEVMSNVKAGVLAAFSVGFDIQDFEIIQVGEGARAYEKEVVKRATLREVSVVTFPAIPESDIVPEPEGLSKRDHNLEHLRVLRDTLAA